MINQQVVDIVDEALTERLPDGVREKILDAVWEICNNELGIDLNTDTEI